MKNEKKRMPMGGPPKISRRIITSIRDTIDKEIIFDRTRETMEQTPFSNAPRNGQGDTVGEKHTNGFRTWQHGDIKYYTGTRSKA